MADINDTLAERGSRYGDFATHAKITQNLKKAMRETPNWDKLTPSMQESLEMNAHKVGRILNGDPTYADSWHDISGYAKLVEDELGGVTAAPLASSSASSLLPSPSAIQSPLSSKPSEPSAAQVAQSPASSAASKPAGPPQPAGGPAAPAGGPVGR